MLELIVFGSICFLGYLGYRYFCKSLKEKIEGDTERIRRKIVRKYIWYLKEIPEGKKVVEKELKKRLGKKMKYLPPKEGIEDPREEIIKELAYRWAYGNSYSRAKIEGSEERSEAKGIPSSPVQDEEDEELE